MAGKKKNGNLFYLFKIALIKVTNALCHMHIAYPTQMSEMIDLLIHCPLLDSCWLHEFVSSIVDKLLLKRNKMNFLFVMLTLLRTFVVILFSGFVYSFANDVCDSVQKKRKKKRVD